MDLQSWLLYLSFVAVIIVVPGPSAALCLSHGVMHGPWRAQATIVGGMVASSILMLLSALGLGAAVAASSTLFMVIKFVGALYLIGLGVSLWRARPATAGDAATTAAVSPAASLGKLSRQGFAVGIANPKDLLFFGALFPQFIDPGQPIAAQLAVLGLTWLAVDGLTMSAYAALGSKLAPKVRSATAARAVNRLTGGFFIAAGGLLAVARR